MKARRVNTDTYVNSLCVDTECFKPRYVVAVTAGEEAM